MSGLSEFLERLCDTGEVLLRELPRFDQSESGPILDYLTQLHGDLVLELAGPAPAFDATTALAAAQLTWRACWFLVSHEELAPQVEEQIRMPAGPATAAAHFSADLTFSHLPQVCRRANARSGEDVLSKQLRMLLRQWPLSGVLADITEAASTAPQFDQHLGLLLLYAERWARNPKPLWRGEGLIAEYCAWIGQELATPLP